MEDVVNQENQGMALKAFKKYVICLVLFILSLSIAISLGYGWLGWIVFFTYCGCGIYLNRTVLRKLVKWHPMYNTIGNVSNAKLSKAVLWPTSYFMLFFRLGVNKVL